MMDDKNTIFKLQKELERFKKSVKKQNYGLVWMDVPEAFEDDAENKLPILKEVPDLAIKNDDGKPTHILIEGDNYHALTCLNYTHKGKIDVIYIDPPYNTGSDGFRYKDKRMINKFPDGTEIPKDHPIRHSYWLSFMRKRLELARDLLSDTGVIFISIDDNEIAQLKLLCDKIFGEKNNLGIIIWHKKTQPSYLSKELINVTEYILTYKKTQKIVPLKGGFTDKNKLVEMLNISNSYCERTFKKDFVMISNGVSCELKSGEYGNGKLKVKLHDNLIIKDGKPNRDIHISGRFKWSQDSINEAIEEGGIIHFKSIKTLRATLQRNSNEEKIKPPISLFSKYVNGIPTNTDATNELKDLFNGVSPMDYPKPTGLIRYLIDSVTYDNPNAVILDFFAGSGTTGHAVLINNEEKKNTKQFILVTNDENKIMSDICYPRITKVIKGYENQNKEQVIGLGNSIKYYKTAFIGKNNILDVTDEDKVELAHTAGELLAIAENTLEIVKQTKYYQLFEDHLQEKYTAIYFREELDQFDKFVEMVEKLNKKTVVYVFSWGEDEFTEEFEHIKDIKVKTIPIPILEIYKNIYNLGGHNV